MFWKIKKKLSEILWNPWKSIQWCVLFEVNEESQVNTDWDEKAWIVIKAVGWDKKYCKETKVKKAELKLNW